MEVHSRALCPAGEFKMRAAAYPGLHGSAKRCSRGIRIRICIVVFKYNLSPHLKRFEISPRLNASLTTLIIFLNYQF